MGAHPDTPHNFPFDGLIDELSVYNRALTTEEVQRIYDTGSQGKVKMTVAKTSPELGSVVAVAPTQFVVDFTFPVDADSIEAPDLVSQRLAADSVTLDDPDTATFTYFTSPVTTQGLQTMHLAEGAVTRASDGLGLAEYHGEFRYDVTPLTVTETDPTAGSDLVLEQLTAPTTAVLSMAGMDGDNGALAGALRDRSRVVERNAALSWTRIRCSIPSAVTPRNSSASLPSTVSPRAMWRRT